MPRGWGLHSLGLDEEEEAVAGAGSTVKEVLESERKARELLETVKKTSEEWYRTIRTASPAQIKAGLKHCQAAAWGYGSGWSELLAALVTMELAMKEMTALLTLACTGLMQNTSFYTDLITTANQVCELVAALKQGRGPHTSKLLFFTLNKPGVEWEGNRQLQKVGESVNDQVKSIQSDLRLLGSVQGTAEITGMQIGGRVVVGGVNQGVVQHVANPRQTITNDNVHISSQRVLAMPVASPPPIPPKSFNMQKQW